MRLSSNELLNKKHKYSNIPLSIHIFHLYLTNILLYQYGFSSVFRHLCLNLEYFNNLFASGLLGDNQYTLFLPGLINKVNYYGAIDNLKTKLYAGNANNRDWPF